MSPKIIIDSAVPYIDGRIEGAETIVLPTAEITQEAVKDADAIIGHTRTYCNPSLLEGSKVKLICTATIGLDHIDTGWCAEKGIEVHNAPGCNAPGVAQYVWASLLSMGFDPAVMTLGIVGHGNVGRVVAEWGRLLGAKILLNDPPRQEAVEEGYTDLDTLLRESDAVTLHTPLTRDGKHPTFHLIGKRELDLMRNGSIIINAARGAVTDTLPLKEALNESRLRGVIDTWEGEPALDKDLLDMVEIGTPHIAGYSLEGKQRATRMALEATGKFFGIPVNLEGLPPNYTPKESLTVQEILSSYNPYADMAPLLASPDSFEKLRKTYKFRKEV